MKRIDLELGPAALDRAARVLVERMGEEAGQYWYVLPAKRGVRKFQEALAHHLPAHLEPPQGISQGAWLDALRPARQSVIDRKAAIHVWAGVLRKASGGDLLRAMGRERPAPDAAQAWFALGQRARDLHAELCQAGLRFENLVEKFPEWQTRWNLWAGWHERYLHHLAEEGFCDGLEERSQAPLLANARVAFVFVPTATPVERATLRELDDRATALVLCDAEHTARFDDQGLLRPAAWATSEVPLALEQWFVEEGPKSQALRARAVLRDWGRSENLAAHEVVLAAPHAEVKPFLERELRTVSIAVHDGAGREFGDTRVAQLLDALQRALPDWRFQDAARLLRHPDWQRAFPSGLHPAWASTADAYQREHYPLHLKNPLDSGHGMAKGMPDVLAALRSKLGPLASSMRGSLPEWADPLRNLLLGVYGQRVWETPSDAECAEQAALEECAAILTRWQDPREAGASWWPEVDGAGACQLLLAELQGRHSAPGREAFRAEGEEHFRVLEMLGWHELLWDDAPALILTGFNEDAVPEKVAQDALLPAAWRRELGLPDGEERAARDLYLLYALLRCRTHMAVISGKRSLEGEPLRPSRLAFFRPDEAIADALRHAFPKEKALQAIPEATQTSGRRTEPMLKKTTPLTRISVTDFKRYLDSPYLYYLQKRLRLDTLDDRGRELDPRSFGNLTHDVLEAFGKSPQKNSPDAQEIEKVLLDCLDRRVRRTFGPDTLPAVQLQLEGLKRRLAWVAEKQAQRARDGWRILEVEWSPTAGSVPLAPANEQGAPAVELAGKIDRVDEHPLHGLAVLDYKTGDAGLDPEKTHRKTLKGQKDAQGKNKKTWTDLQLPLYVDLVQELAGEKDVQVGYFTVGKDENAVAVKTTHWNADEIQSARDLALEIVDKIRQGQFRHDPSARTHDPIFAALVGDTLVGDTFVGVGPEDSELGSEGEGRQ